MRTNLPDNFVNLLGLETFIFYRDDITEGAKNKAMARRLLITYCFILTKCNTKLVLGYLLA